LADFFDERAGLGFGRRLIAFDLRTLEGAMISADSVGAVVALLTLRLLGSIRPNADIAPKAMDAVNRG
jgi:hypothetical protein